MGRMHDVQQVTAGKTTRFPVGNPVIRRLCREVPLMSDAALAGLVQQPFALDVKAGEHGYFKSLRNSMRPRVVMGSEGIATLSIEGVLARRPDPFEMLFAGPMEDVEALQEIISELTFSREVKAVLLDVDSPGGFVNGGPEVADAVKELRKVKPVGVFVGGMVCSLAYWISSQASFIIAGRSAIVGSIGAFATFVDYTKWLDEHGIRVEILRNKEGVFKAAGAMGTGLTEPQRENLLEGVESVFEEFRSAVLTARPGIPKSAMQGQTFAGSRAKSVRLIDAVGDKSYALATLRSLTRP